jgi:hypothetical protein
VPWSKDDQVQADWTNRMPPTRPAHAEAPPQTPLPKPSRSTAATKQAAVNRKVAEMLRDLQIEGKALSAEIERLRHRFL